MVALDAQILRRFAQSRSAILGGLLIAALLTAVILAPVSRSVPRASPQNGSARNRATVSGGSSGLPAGGRSQNTAKAVAKTTTTPVNARRAFVLITEASHGTIPRGTVPRPFPLFGMWFSKPAVVKPFSPTARYQFVFGGAPSASFSSCGTYSSFTAILMVWPSCWTMS